MDATADAADGLDRTAFGYALLFSLPVGVGVSAGVMKTSGGGPGDPLVVLPGAVTAVVIFLFVLFVARGGSTTTNA